MMPKNQNYAMFISGYVHPDFVAKLLTAVVNSVVAAVNLNQVSVRVGRECIYIHRYTPVHVKISPSWLDANAR